MAGYWPSSYSVVFTESRPTNLLKKRMRPTPCHVKRTSLINKEITIWTSEKLFRWDTAATAVVQAGKIAVHHIAHSGTCTVANHHVGFGSSCPLTELAIITINESIAQQLS